MNSDPKDEVLWLQKFPNCIFVTKMVNPALALVEAEAEL